MNPWIKLQQWADEGLNPLSVVLVKGPDGVGLSAVMAEPGGEPEGPLTQSGFWAADWAEGLKAAAELIAEVAVCVTLGIGLYSISNSITVVVGLLLIACVGLFTYVTRRFSKRLGQEAQVYKAKLYQWVNQSLGGIKEVKVLNRESFFVASYQKYYRLYVKGVVVLVALSNVKSCSVFT